MSQGDTDNRRVMLASDIDDEVLNEFRKKIITGVKKRLDGVGQLLRVGKEKSSFGPCNGVQQGLQADCDASEGKDTPRDEVRSRLFVDHRG